MIDVPEGKRLALHPLLALTCTQPLRHGVAPTSSLPLAGYVPPEVLAPLGRLHVTLARSWAELVRAAHCRGRTVETEVAEGILWDIARELHGRDEALAAVVTLDEHGRQLRPRAPLQVDRLCYPIASLELGRGRGERPRVSIGLDLEGALAASGVLLGLCAAGAPPPIVGAFLDEQPAAFALFKMRMASQLVAAAPRRARLHDEIGPGTIAHLGHATLLANLGGAHVLVDPWLPPAAIGDAPPPLSPSELPPLAAILVTHHHFDHVHIETLLALDKRAPIVVPRQSPIDAEHPIAPRTAQLLAELGFVDVRTMAPGDALTIGDRGRVIAAPFFGEDPTHVGYAGLCYVLEHEGRACLVHVDSAADRDDRTLASTGIAAELARTHGPLSPVFATRRQERGTMIDYSWEALLRPAREWVSPTENCATGGELLASLCAAVGAGCLALYSEGGADWYPEWTNFIPRHGVALARPYQYLWESLDEIAAAVREVGAETILSRPYSRYQIGGGPDGVCSARSSIDAY